MLELANPGYGEPALKDTLSKHISHITCNSSISGAQLNVFLSKFTKLCRHHHKLVLEHFHLPSKILHAHLQSPLPSPATTNILSVSINLPFLNISCKWSYTTCGLLCPASVSIMFLRFICVIACVIILFLFPKY